MTARREFSRKVRAFVALRAGGRCESCAAKLKVSEGEYDHVLANELGGEATAENCRLLCKPCHREKTTADVRIIRKADRQRDKHTRAMKPAARPIPGSRSTKFKKHIDGSVSYR